MKFALSKFLFFTIFFMPLVACKETDFATKSQGAKNGGNSSEDSTATNNDFFKNGMEDDGRWKDADGNYIDADGNRVDIDGDLVDEDGKKILDGNGQPIKGNGIEKHLEELAKASNQKDGQDRPISVNAKEQIAQGGIKGNAISRADISDLCNNSGVVQSGKNTVSFASVKECAWNRDGNLGRKDKHYQARMMQSKDMNIPTGAVLCSLDVRSKSDRIHYDDVMLLTINNNVILSSAKDVPGFLGGGNVPKWDFERVKGKRGDFNSGEFCLGQNSRCELPGHDKKGSIAVDFEDGVMLDLASEIGYGSQKVMNVITLGDNDKEDCFHSGIELEVQYTYVKK